ncbi:MAG: hypothetical protein JXA67_08235 [Micromonosporaceae bacterium]|nr:hypothetical protein [Micromonosporaceae bacterium]
MEIWIAIVIAGVIALYALRPKPHASRRNARRRGPGSGHGTHHHDGVDWDDDGSDNGGDSCDSGGWDSGGGDCGGGDGGGGGGD